MKAVELAVSQEGLLAKNRLSNNVGGVKAFWSVAMRARRRARQFALLEQVPYQPRLARNRFQVRNLGPTHASLRSATAIMITTPNSPVKGSGTPNPITPAVPSKNAAIKLKKDAHSTASLGDNTRVETTVAMLLRHETHQGSQRSTQRGL
jgi:hypothetical protein